MTRAPGRRTRRSTALGLSLVVAGCASSEQRPAAPFAPEKLAAACSDVPALEAVLGAEQREGNLDLALRELEAFERACKRLPPSLTITRLELLASVGDDEKARALAREIVTRGSDDGALVRAAKEALARPAPEPDSLAKAEALWSGADDTTRPAAAARLDRDKALHMLERLTGKIAMTDNLSEATFISWDGARLIVSVTSEKAGSALVAIDTSSTAGLRARVAMGFLGERTVAFIGGNALVTDSEGNVSVSTDALAKPIDLPAGSPVFSPTGGVAAILGSATARFFDIRSQAVRFSVEPAVPISGGSFLDGGETFLGNDGLVVDVVRGAVLLDPRKAARTALSPSGKTLAAVTLAETSDEAANATVELWDRKKIGAPHRVEIGPVEDVSNTIGGWVSFRFIDEDTLVFATDSSTPELDPETTTPTSASVWLIDSKDARARKARRRDWPRFDAAARLEQLARELSPIARGGIVVEHPRKQGTFFAERWYLPLPFAESASMFALFDRRSSTCSDECPHDLILVDREKRRLVRRVPLPAAKDPTSSRPALARFSGDEKTLYVWHGGEFLIDVSTGAVTPVDTRSLHHTVPEPTFNPDGSRFAEALEIRDLRTGTTLPLPFSREEPGEAVCWVGRVVAPGPVCSSRLLPLRSGLP